MSLLYLIGMLGGAKRLLLYYGKLSCSQRLCVMEVQQSRDCLEYYSSAVLHYAFLCEDLLELSEMLHAILLTISQSQRQRATSKSIIYASFGGRQTKLLKRASHFDIKPRLLKYITLLGTQL